MDTGAQQNGTDPAEPDLLDRHGSSQRREAEPSNRGDQALTPAPRSYATDPRTHAANNGRGMYLDRQTSRHTASRSKTKKIRRLTALVTVLAVALVVVSMGWIMAWAKLKKVESDALSLDVNLRQTGGQLQSLKAQLLEREAAVQAMVEKRIPGLSLLEYNKVIDVKDKYVRNIRFAQSGTADAKAIEYHTILKNDTADLGSPKVKIFLFDQFGIETGFATLQPPDAADKAGSDELQPGETRSYTGKMDIQRQAVPKYFLIQVQ
jgi:cell division protein FtsL